MLFSLATSLIHCTKHRIHVCVCVHIHRFQVSRNVRDSHEILLDPAVTHESSNCHEFPLKPII